MIIDLKPLKHDEAGELERIVSELYGIDRHQMPAMINADVFEDYPLEAATMIMSYLYARKLAAPTKKHSEFISKYRELFYDEKTRSKYDFENEVKKYIEILTDMVNQAKTE